MSHGGQRRGRREAPLGGISPPSLAADSTLMWLVGNAAAYLALGVLIFRACERIAKRRGMLGQY